MEDYRYTTNTDVRTMRFGRASVSRRGSFRFSSLVLGRLAVGIRPSEARADGDTHGAAPAYAYFEYLDEFVTGTPIEPNELRITFLGSGFPTVRMATDGL